jgi:hypothetical protein
MRVTELIEKLTAMKQKLGDVEVLITDGFDCRGDFLVQEWHDFEGTGQMTVDIGIGGCLEE